MDKKRLKQLKNGIAERIKTILEEKDWFQQELVRRTGMHKGHISLLLNGEVNLTLETIVALEEALGEPIIEVANRKR
jgi:transcriptional regulator with XRE-family HTH domain